MINFVVGLSRYQYLKTPPLTFRTILPREEWEWGDSYWELRAEMKNILSSVHWKVWVMFALVWCLQSILCDNWMTFIFWGKKINNVISNRLEVGLISLEWRKPSYLLLISQCQGEREGWEATISDKVKVLSRAGLVIYGILGSPGDGWRADGLSNCLLSLALLRGPGGLPAVLVKKLMRQHFVGKPRYQTSSLTEPPTSFLSVVDDWIFTHFEIGKPQILCSLILSECE